MATTPTAASVAQQIADGQTLLGQLTSAITLYSSQIAPQRAALVAGQSTHIEEIMAGRAPDVTALINLGRQVGALSTGEDGLARILAATATYLPPVLATLTALQPLS